MLGAASRPSVDVDLTGELAGAPAAAVTGSEAAPVVPPGRSP